MKYDLSPVSGVRCPACFGERGKLLFDVSSEQAAQHFARIELDRPKHEKLRGQIERGWKQNRARVIHCDTCGFCFADPYVAGSAEFYATMLDSPSFPQSRWEFGVTRDAIAGLVKSKPGLSMLEIGAGDGAFVRMIAPALIPKDHVTCTEYSPAGAEAIRRYGVTCEMIDARTLANSHKGKFDVICLFQVLEHLDDLESLWESLGALASPAAHLFLSVPNDRFIESCETHGGLLDMPPNHLGRWNRQCFDSIAARHGWALRRHETEPAALFKAAWHLAASRYQQWRLTPKSLANRLSLLRSRPLRRAAGLPMFALTLIATLPIVLTRRAARTGAAQWAQFEKAS
jgi:2-polyprenyl-3-methyl-5-hydroxy-6-metoxy-1,4-benzoquinol methylase